MFRQVFVGDLGIVCSFVKIRQGLAGLIMDGVIHDAHESWDLCLSLAGCELV